MSSEEIARKRLNAIQQQLTRSTGPADLSRERANASFDVNQMKTFFAGGKEFSEAMDDAYRFIQRDPELYLGDEYIFDASVTEQREATMRQLRRYVEVRDMLKSSLLVRAFHDAMCQYSEAFSMRLYVHEILFPQALRLFGTSEQYSEWIDDLLSWRIIGCFAMTELGYSSFLRGLETTATFDKKADEFIINSPSILSTKWWVGMAGETATHTIVLAQTVVDGKKCGIDWFVVPLRSRKTGRLVAGVAAGNIGTKYGRNGLDNGWIQFSGIRIPRTNMMMRWASVSPDGKYHPSPNPALSYAPLIGERLEVIRATISTASRALTIACRYGCVRRQGANNEQIMDFQSYYVQLMPGIAGLYVANIIDRITGSKWNKLVDNVDDGTLFLNNIADIHGISAGLKSIYGWWGVDILEFCRRSLGGHAYSSYNAIGEFIQDFSPITTGGGDNYTLMNQAAKYVLGSLKMASNGIKLEGSVAYLNNIQEALSRSNSSMASENEILDLNFITGALAWLSIRKAKAIETTLSGGGVAVWNDNIVHLIKLAEIHTHHYILSEYHNDLVEYGSTEYKDLLPMLTQMGQLWGTYVMQSLLELFLEEGYFSPSQAKMVKKVFYDLCRKTRKEVIPLVDAWAVPDFILKAPLGRYDGDIYPAYFNRVRNTPGCVGVPSYWSKYIKPMTDPDS
ncbi:5443_t:CDS:10 [Paraglomus brasilianum]|uniref:Acyl-coenzyme A oxidase n=1 Tax=Paraglomus brasilianum TaxID=144538 RepID=A0A9N9A772_9GLOM|nr:5443_t:CDS:10 [Paraglomus brasilianum]